MNQKRNGIAAALAAATLLIAGTTNVMAQEMADLAMMPREVKVGQMLLVSPTQLCGGQDWTGDINQVLGAMDSYYIGGLIFFEEDLQNKDAVAELLGAVQARNGLPVLTVAAAGGSLTDGLIKPEKGTQFTIGAYDQGANGVWAYGLAEEVPEEYAALGFTAAAVPGDGSKVAVVTNARVTGEPTDGVDHAVDEGRPAAMAKSMVSRTLRPSFAGLIMTDSLSMEAATGSYGADMAVMYALQAGNDLITAPANVMSAYYGILSAIDEQLVTEEQINETVNRILTYKQSLLQ